MRRDQDIFNRIVTWGWGLLLLCVVVVVIVVCLCILEASAQDATPPSPINSQAVPALYGPSGLITSPKCWQGSTATATGGTFSFNISSATFHAAPNVNSLVVQAPSPIALSSYYPNVDTASATTITGHITGGLTLSILGATVALGPAGVNVWLYVCGN